ncbi:hypothetical protein HAHE_39510 [Haloferula helveola]|uniref:Prepilin-type N-terminal cleavage/methylation domain-containing protein n=1 Tax=Haloferula helveola TaxID=490095 RepID=A0ABM7RRF8_9BACT|nr:hypothetical protein HAHE_39510 [Haloferula helveola]
MTVSSSIRRSRGFTLLELVIAIGLVALLMGMIFSIATQNLRLANTVVEQQNEVSAQTAFFDLLGSQFASLPGNARMELVSEDSGAQYLSDLTIQNVPLTFTWGGTERVAKAVQISTERRRDGFLDIVLRYFDEEILEETTEVGDSSSTLGDAEPFAEIVLMEDVYIFEWEALDGRMMEWDYKWDYVGRLPLQLALTYVPDSLPGTDPIRHVFWITPKQDPSVLMRQLQQQGQGGGAATPGGNPAEGGEGAEGQPPSVTVPGVPGVSVRPGLPSGGPGGRGQGGGGR